MTGRALPLLILGLGAVSAIVGALVPATGPLRFFGAAVGFGFASGVAAAWLSAPEDRRWLRAARAIFLAPLLSAALSLVFLAGGWGTAKTAVAVLVVAYGSAAAVLLRDRAVLRPTPLWERRAAVWTALLFLIALLPHVVREWVRYRSDAWFHTAVALEIAARGVPPGDPYFAGFELNYLWFYHGLLAVWSTAAGVMPWSLGGLLNALWFASLGAAVFALSRRAGRPGREAFFAALFVPLGLDALFYLGFPLKLVRGLVGETAGWEELRRLFSMNPFTFGQVWHVTSSYGSPPPVVNKYLVMTALGGGVTALAWWAEGLVGWARPRGVDGRRRSILVALATIGLWLWHPAIGIAAAIAALFAAAVLLIRPGPVPRSRVVLAAVAMGGGTVIALPVLLASVSRAEGPFPVGWTPAAPAILLGSTAALLLGIPALVRLRARSSARVFQVTAWSMMAAAFLVVLPDPNTQDKLPFVFYLLPATAAGWTLARLWRRWQERGQRLRAVLLLSVLLVPINVLFLGVYLFEAAPPSLSPEETELYTWLRDNTPHDAVILDTAERAEVLVHVPRRQYWGREPYALQWGYSPGRLQPRREARDALVRPGPIGTDPESVRTLERGVMHLDRFAREDVGPLYVLWRPRDHDGQFAASSPMARRPERFEPMWANPEATVYRFRANARFGDEP